MKMKKTDDRLLTFLHLWVFLSTLVITVIGVVKGAGSGQVGDGMYGIGYFKAYTVDSNILAGLASLWWLLRKDDDRVFPLFHLAAVTSVMLTFTVVLFFLAPVNGFLKMYADDMFFFHLLNPLLSVWMLRREHYDFKKNAWLYAAIPTVMYAAVYLVEVVFLQAWHDFYGFTFGGKMFMVPIVIVVIVGTACLLGKALIRISRK